MIPESQADIIYFSELLKSSNQYKEAFFRIQRILDKYYIDYRFLKSTKGIWCRDYMPIQVNENKLIQFRYESSYPEGDGYHRSDPEEVCKSNGFEPIFSNINLDGGNVIAWENKVIISDRIFTENPEYTNKSELISNLEALLEAEVIIIPTVKGDMTGHADGYVRFLNSTTLIGNDLGFEYQYWSKLMKKVLKDHGLEYINMPAFEHSIKGNDYHAIGYYMIYLEVGNLIIFPVFEVPGNKDQDALDLMAKLYPGKIIEPIVLNEVALEGGLMHCVSWNCKYSDMEG